MNDTVELTVLLLTLNEAGTLGILLDTIKATVPRQVPSYELLVVDGGSTDATTSIARQAGARVETQSEPGYGNAYRQGLASSRGRYILTLDADGSHPVEMLDRFLSQRERYDVVNGSRYLTGSEDRRPPLRKYMSFILNHVYAMVLRVPLTDISGGFRIYRAEAAQRTGCYEEQYDVPAELMVRLYGLGYRVLEVPYRYEERKAGISKVRLLHFSFCYCRTLVRLWWWLRVSRRAAAGSE